MQGMLLPLAVVLSLVAPVAIAAPQDPARVDGPQPADPAAVFSQPASPARHAASIRTMQPSGLLSGDAWHRIAPLSPDRYRQAYGNADVRSRLGRTYSSGASDPSGPGGWLRQLMAPHGDQPGRDLDLQQGMRTAQDTMDAMGRQLMPALRDLKRDFDAGLERASDPD